MSKEAKKAGKGPGSGGSGETGGGPGTGDVDRDKYNAIEFDDVLPKNINELSEVFDDLGPEGEYGRRAVYKMYLSPDTIGYYSKGVWNTVLVKANKTDGTRSLEIDGKPKGGA